MKHINLIMLSGAFAVISPAETTLQKDPPLGFVHLQEKDSIQLRDVFLSTDQIVSIVVAGSPEGDDKWGTVTITTTAINPNPNSDSSKGAQYTLEFKSRAEALETVSKLLPNKAQETGMNGAEQPAPAPKLEAAATPQTGHPSGTPWEYSLLNYPATGANHGKLTELGIEGWEVTAVLQGQISNSTTLLLKRQKN